MCMSMEGPGEPAARVKKVATEATEEKEGMDKAGLGEQRAVPVATGVMAAVADREATAVRPVQSQ